VIGHVVAHWWPSSSLAHQEKTDSSGLCARHVPLRALACAPRCKKKDKGQVVMAAAVLLFLDTRRSNLHQVRQKTGGETVSTRSAP